MTAVKRTCRSSNGDALVPLRVLSTLAGLDVTYEPSTAPTNGTLKVELDVSTTNAFTNTQSSYSSRGLTGCARSICKAVPECGLWGDVGGDAGVGKGAERESAVEGWVESSVDALAGAAYGVSDERVKDPHFKGQVTEFAASIEKHLSSQKYTYLIGDVATAADVVASILLAVAAKRTGVTSLPKEVARLVETVLKNPVVAGVVGDAVTIPSSAAAGDKKPAAAPAKAAAAGDVSFDDNTIVQKLNELGIPHNTYAHTLCMTADELVSNVPIPEGETHTKNILFRDKKHGMFLVTVRTDADVNTKTLGKALKLEGKVNLRLADEKILDETLQVKKGCVGPLAMMNNAKKDVTLVLDEGLLSVTKIHSHPLRNDASTVLVPDDLMKFVKAVGHEPILLPFETKGAAPAGGDKKGEKWEGKAPSSRPPADKQKAKAEHPKGASAPAKEKNKDKKTTKKGETLLALQWKKTENFPMWYSDVIVLSEMISYYDISGCYILRPWSYKIWELIQEWFNPKIRELDVENSYFPLFVSQDRLEREKDHVEGFAPEVAWVTKSGDGELAKQIAIRPTSETIMYPAFADWIRSHRDLPLKLNQWSNVVRWEFKDPTPFLRTREFLWQEGHTAHVSHDDADKMVMEALELYRGVYEDLLAIPVVPGYKTEKEKFAGGHQTTTVEAYIPIAGRAIQGATSHNLGQNFGKMFDITYQDEKGDSQVVWQTSWGLTTRTIGVMVMVHGDDIGLVLPPKVAPLQVVIVPIVSKKCTMSDISPYCESILKDLIAAGVRAKFDDRDMYNPGWKYNHWEQKGVPIRIEVGPRDIEKKQARVVVRHSGEKIDTGVDTMGSFIVDKLAAVQTAMFEKAKETRDQHLVQITEWNDFVPNLEKHNLVLTPWCGGEHQDWEEWVKEKSREESLANSGQEGEDERAATSVAAKTLCIPFKQPELPEGTKCIASGLPAKCWVLWGRSY